MRRFILFAAIAALTSTSKPVSASDDQKMTIIPLKMVPVGEHSQETDLKKMFPQETSKAEELLRNLAQGNERSAEITKAVINTDNGDVTLEAMIRSKHRVKGGGLVPYDVTVYDWTVTGKFEFNLRTGKCDGEVDFGHGIKVSTKTIADLFPNAK